MDNFTFLLFILPALVLVIMVVAYFLLKDVSPILKDLTSLKEYFPGFVIAFMVLVVVSLLTKPTDDALDEFEKVRG